MKMKDGKLEIYPQDIAESLSKEDRMEFIKHHVLCADAIQTVLDYICDGDEDGWWTGDSDEIRAAFLRRVEDTHLAQFSRYNWKSLGVACDKITKIRSEQHLYWKLYHHPESHNLTIAEWIMKHDVNKEICEYQSKIADDEIDRIVNDLKEEIRRIRESTKTINLK